MDEQPTRRRRRRRSSGGTPVVETPVPAPPRPATSDRRHDRADRELAGSAHSQVGVQRALRARDVNRPTEKDLAAAEDEVVIVRRNWTPAP